MAVETFCQYFQSALNFAGKQFKHLDRVLDTNTCTWFYIRMEGWQDFHRTATSFVDKLNNLICSEIAITQLTILVQSPSQFSDCHLLLLHGRWEKRLPLSPLRLQLFRLQIVAWHARRTQRNAFPIHLICWPFRLLPKRTKPIYGQICIGIFQKFGECSDTAVWTRKEMSRDFFVKASLTFFYQIILPIRNQMVGKV